MIEDLQTLELIGGLDIEPISVQTKVEMVSILKSLKDRASDGLRPILHFDCHGSEYGLLINSKELLEWEYLSVLLRQINVETKNNLICVFAACFGLNFGKALSLSDPTPWYIMIAPENEISVGALEEKTRPFYETLISSGSINQAFRSGFDSEMQMFNCQVLFAKGIATYIQKHATGKALRERTEKLLSRTVEQSRLAGNPISLRIARARIKKGLKPGQDLIDRFAPIFLIGRKPAIDFKIIQRIVARTKPPS